ncbi:MAG: serine/threonine protein kinase [Planctomycetales bacterium]|nr:serine/threonine protein kinase [Planctomycetales bacterium]
MSQAPFTSPAPLPEPDLSGRRLGDYQLLRRLGRGGMAEVYLAEQLSLRRQVAFKVLRSNLALDAAYVRRFHNEAQAAAKLVHANIVQIHEVNCIDGTHFIVQEYVAGQNLKQVLTRRGSGLEAAPAANIIRQVAAALHKAAEQNIIHRDIKPENIMLAPSGEVKVADFGLARVVREGEAMNLTEVGITMGTPLYMSPEQVEGKDVDPRSDIYSLGVTAYQMIAGRPPFDGETALAIAIQHLKNEPTRLETLRPDIPSGLCRIVHKMLAKNPQDRFQKAADVLKELRTLTITGLGDDWQNDLAGWSTTEMVANGEGRTEATQMLATVLIEQKKLSAQRARWWLAILCLLLSVPLGAGAAYLAQPQPLLTTAQQKTQTVPKLQNAQIQYNDAFFTPSEEAWKAVAEYFPASEDPKNQIWCRRATRRLGEFYLSQGEFEKALLAYQELAGLEETAQEFRISGMAGEAVVYDHFNNRGEVIARLRQLVTKDAEYQLLHDNFLRGEVDRLKAKYTPERKK